MPVLRRNRNTVERATRACSPQEQRFCEEYLVDLDPQQAALRAGLPKASGSHLLKSQHIQQAIARERARRSNRTQVYADHALQCYRRLAFADARRISEHWQKPCRCCWGVDHQPQFTDGELRVASNQHRFAQLKLSEEDRVPFDERGGGGYTINRLPCRGVDYCFFLGVPEENATADHTCPECHGHGLSHVIFHDTRGYDEPTTTLYRGVKISKNGDIEILTRDQDHALDILARHLGLIGPEAAKPQRVPNPSELSDDELVAFLESRGVSVDADYEDVTGAEVSGAVPEGGADPDGGSSIDAVES